MRRLLVSVAVASLVAGCGASTPNSLPAESAPPAPAAPAGWVSIASISGTGGAGSVGTNLDLGGRKTALHAACVGLGNLVVQIGDAPVAPAVVFPCGGHGSVADNRFEITSMTSAGRSTLLVSVIEGPADLYNSSFAVSIEQPQS